MTKLSTSRIQQTDAFLAFANSEIQPNVLSCDIKSIDLYHDTKTSGNSKQFNFTPHLSQPMSPFTTHADVMHEGMDTFLRGIRIGEKGMCEKCGDVKFGIGGHMVGELVAQLLGRYVCMECPGECEECTVAACGGCGESMGFGEWDYSMRGRWRRC